MKKSISILLSILMILVVTFPSAAATSAKASTKPVELKVAYLSFVGEPKELSLVETAINKITLPKINATVKLMPISAGQYAQQMNLILSGGEKMDLFVLFMDNRVGFITRGQVLPLDDLLNKYGQDIKTTIGKEYLRLGMLNGKTYSVPTSNTQAGAFGIAMRKDIVEKDGINLSKIKTLDDLDAVYKVIKAKEPTMYPIIPAMQGMSVLATYTSADIMGDGYGVLMNNGTSDLKVVNWYETPEYAKLINTMRRWYQSGFIMKGASINKEDQVSMYKSGKAFSSLAPLMPGIDETNSNSYTVPMTSVKLMPAVANSFAVNQWAIAKNSKTPEKAMEFLNLVYSNKDIANILAYGIEGKHYTKLADGSLDFPTGVKAETVGYPNNMAWELVYQPITYVWKGQPQWRVSVDFAKSAVKSKAFGFNFDGNSVKTEVTAVSNVISQYKLPLENGEVDPAKILPQFIEKLKASGINKIIAEKQKQLNAWAKANGVK